MNNIGSFNKQTIISNNVSNVASLNFTKEPKNNKQPVAYKNTVSKSKSVTLDLSQFIEEFNEPITTNQQVTEIETLFNEEQIR